MDREEVLENPIDPSYLARGASRNQANGPFIFRIKSTTATTILKVVVLMSENKQKKIEI